MRKFYFAKNCTENQARGWILSEFLKISGVKIFSNQKMLTVKKVQKHHIWGARRFEVFFLFLASFARYRPKTISRQPYVVDLLNKKYGGLCSIMSMKHTKIETFTSICTPNDEE